MGVLRSCLTRIIIRLAPRASKMKRILCWLPSGLIGYPSGQDGSILPARDFPLCFLAEAKFFVVIFWPYNKSFIDQACGQDGWILAKFCFFVFMPMSCDLVVWPQWPHEPGHLFPPKAQPALTDRGICVLCPLANWCFSEILKGFSRCLRFL